jgi:hypothetical protein
MSVAARASGERGFALITVGVCLVATIGMLGLATDIGRMYIVRNEMQAYVDAASLAAALELDGAATGIARAQSSIPASSNRWLLGTSPFTGTQLDFAPDSTGPWVATPSPASGYRYARVRAAATVPLYFIGAVVSARTTVINGTAVAGQVSKINFSEGMFPFSPFAHNNGQADFGFTTGQHYTLRWASNPKLNANVCPGDDAPQWIAAANANGGSERGYYEFNSSDIIRMAIEQDYLTAPLTIGTSVNMTGGAKQTQRTSLIVRINQDTDPNSASYAQYAAAGTGNGRRLVAVPVNSGSPYHNVLGYALFFLLLPSEYNKSGNQPFCAEYVGPYVQGSRHSGAGGPGTYVVRLVQ